jgi:hypothetical protein
MGMSLLPIQMAGTKHFERDAERDRSQVGCGRGWPTHIVTLYKIFILQRVNRAAVLGFASVRRR